MVRLYVNVDHVATLRQQRGTRYPDPVAAATLCELAGADGITVHLREDRRHIQDRDVRVLRETVAGVLNLEMAATEEMLRIALAVKPDFCTLVPEKREERTTEGGLILGGEQSGHIIFLDHATTGDGMVAALMVLAAMVREGKPLSELAAAMTRYPQVLLNFAVARKRPFEEMPTVQRLIEKVERDLGAEGRVVVRYSGTESKARVMIEGTDEAGIRARADEIARTLQEALSA